MAALTVKVMRSWDSAEPIILSVGEDAEVSIGNVARLVAGMYREVTILHFKDCFVEQKKWVLLAMLFLTPPRVMASIRKLRITRG